MISCPLFHNRIINNILVPGPSEVSTTINNISKQVSQTVNFDKHPLSTSVKSGTLSSLSSLAKLVLSTSVKSALKPKKPIIPKPFNVKYDVKYDRVKFRTPPPLRPSSSTGRSIDSYKPLPYLPLPNAFVVKDYSPNRDNRNTDPKWRSWTQRQTPSNSNNPFNIISSTPPISYHAKSRGSNINLNLSKDDQISRPKSNTPIYRNSFKFAPESNQQYGSSQTFQFQPRQEPEHIVVGFQPNLSSFRRSSHVALITKKPYHNGGSPSVVQTLSNSWRRGSYDNSLPKFNKFQNSRQNYPTWSKVSQSNYRNTRPRRSIKSRTFKDEPSTVQKIDSDIKETSINDSVSEQDLEGRIMTGNSGIPLDDEVSAIV